MKGEDNADREVVGEVAGGDTLCAGVEFAGYVVSTLTLEERLASSILEVQKCTYSDPSPRDAVGVKSKMLHNGK